MMNNAHLQRVQERMKERGIDAYMVLSQDDCW